MADVATKAPVTAAPGAGMRSYALILLMFVLTVNFLDRQILTILLEPIRHDLSLTDTQIGELTALAFTVPYTLLLIPVGRLSDRWSRRKVITIAISIWSLMTIFCGLARNFPQILLARMGVGIGQTGGTPPSTALAGDLYPREQRSTAIAILLLSQPIGYVVAYLSGGWMVGSLGWRQALIFAGIPGLVLALLVLFTLPETQKGMADGVQTPQEPQPLWKVIRMVWSIRTLRYMTLASMLQSFLQLGLTQWVPSFLTRSYGMNSAAIGEGMAFAMGVGFFVGTLGGGRLVDMLGRRDLRWHFWMPTIAVIIAAGCSVAAFSGPREAIFVLLCGQIIFGSLWASSFSAIATALVPVSARATMLATLLFCVNIFAIGVGPVVMGKASDLLRASYGEESLHLTLIGAAMSAFPAALFYFLASFSYRSELAAADARNQAT